MGSRGSFPVLGFLLAATLLFAANLTAAEEMTHAETAPTSEKRTDALCWRGHPYPECRSFLVTEVGISYPWGNTPTYDGGAVIAGDLGWMKNISERAAVGGTAHARLGEDYARAGVRARYRRWLGRSTSVDLSPGIIVLNKDETYNTDYLPPGFVGGAALNLGDLFALSLEAEYGRYSVREYTATEIHRSRSSQVTWRLGWKAGSLPGSIGMVAFIAGGIIYTLLLGESSG